MDRIGIISTQWHMMLSWSIFSNFTTNTAISNVQQGRIYWISKTDTTTKLRKPKQPKERWKSIWICRGKKILLNFNLLVFQQWHNIRSLQDQHLNHIGSMLLQLKELQVNQPDFHLLLHPRHCNQQSLQLDSKTWETVAISIRFCSAWLQWNLSAHPYWQVNWQKQQIPNHVFYKAQPLRSYKIIVNLFKLYFPKDSNQQGKNLMQLLQKFTKKQSQNIFNPVIRMLMNFWH